MDGGGSKLAKKNVSEAQFKALYSESAFVSGLPRCDAREIPTTTEVALTAVAACTVELCRAVGEEVPTTMTAMIPSEEECRLIENRMLKEGQEGR